MQQISDKQNLQVNILKR